MWIVFAEIFEMGAGEREKVESLLAGFVERSEKIMFAESYTRDEADKAKWQDAYFRAGSYVREKEGDTDPNNTRVLELAKKFNQGDVDSLDQEAWQVAHGYEESDEMVAINLSADLLLDLAKSFAKELSLPDSVVEGLFNGGQLLVAEEDKKTTELLEERGSKASAEAKLVRMLGIAAHFYWQMGLVRRGRYGKDYASNKKSMIGTFEDMKIETSTANVAKDFEPVVAAMTFDQRNE